MIPSHSLIQQGKIVKISLSFRLNWILGTEKTKELISLQVAGGEKKNPSFHFLSNLDTSVVSVLKLLTESFEALKALIRDQVFLFLLTANCKGMIAFFVLQPKRVPITWRPSEINN